MQLYNKKSILIDLKKHKSFLDKNIEKYIIYFLWILIKMYGILLMIQPAMNL